MDLLTIVLVFIVYAAKAQEICQTPNGQNGECIIVQECSALMTILQGPRPIPSASLDLLRNSQCGFIGSKPKVCCPSTTSRGATTNDRIISPSSTTTTTASNIMTPNPPDAQQHPNMRLLNNDICGPVTQPKIVGGNKTGVLDYPWMALIAYEIRGRKEFRCGGSIINKRYILTAAHCVTGLPAGANLIGVRVGEHDLRTERDCDKDEEGQEIICGERYQDFGIENIQYHDNFTHSSLQNDIALLRVNADIDFRPLNVKPICLPIGTAAILRSKKVTVTGWGTTELGTRSQDLLMVKLTPVNNEECAEVFKPKTQISYKQICAGGKNHQDSCQGDSGGPLQAPAIYNNNPRYVQYGIVSFGLKWCGTEGYPGVYTRVTYYVDWILNRIRD